MQTSFLSYEADGNTFEAFIARDQASAGPRPAVVVCHAWGGQSQHERTWAISLAALGYVGVAIDVYGKGVRPESTEQKQALMMPLVEDRGRLEDRLRAGLEAVRNQEDVDEDRVAAVGFCFGGLCVLDMARACFPIRGVVSFHGLLKPRERATPRIEAPILVCHGYDDPMVRPEAVVAFAEEMTLAKADWQLIAYGGAQHSFTHPDADDPGRGTVYDEATARRSRAAMESFLREVL